MNNCIVYITDDKYLLYTINSIKTFKKFNKKIPVYVLFNFNIKHDLNNNQITNSGDIYFIDIKEIYTQLIAKKIHKNSISQIKWYLPEMDFFKKYDRVLYVDGDTEFCDNIDSFFNYEFDEDILGIDDTILRDYDINRYKIYRKYKYTFKNYINSGVILYNTKNFNHDKNIKIFNNCVNTYNKLSLNLFDQDMINIFFNIKCIYDYRFNNYTYFLKDMFKKVYINHYIAEKKFLLNKILQSFFPFHSSEM